MRTLLPLVLALAGSGLFLTGCTEETDVVYTERPAIYGTTADVDFYYVGDAPYSRQYGMLYYRDNGYYYRQNNNYVIYNRPVLDRRDHYTRVNVDNSRERRGQWDERYERWDLKRDQMRDDRRSDRGNEYRPASNEDRSESRQKTRARGTNQQSDEDLQKTIDRRKTASN